LDHCSRFGNQKTVNSRKGKLQKGKLQKGKLQKGKLQKGKLQKGRLPRFSRIGCLPAHRQAAAIRRKTLLSESSNFADAAPDGPFMFEIPALIRTELNADVDRHVLARMRYLARQKRLLQPHITDEEMADCLALAENYPNFGQWLSARQAAMRQRTPGSGDFGHR